MQLAKTLSALALLGAAVPSTYALSIKDDTVKLGVGIRLQTRATIADATGPTGDDYRVQGGVDGAVNDPIDFSVRRARLYLKIGYGDNWSGQLAMNADEIDAGSSGNPTATTGSGTNRGAQVRYAWVKRTFKMEGDMKHSLAAGLMKPYNVPGDGAISSSKRLFPMDNYASGIGAIREIGLEYMFNHPVFTVAAHVFNNESNKDVSTAESAAEEEGFNFGARVEFSFSPEWFLSKRSESYLGKEGKGVNFGLSYIANADEVNDDNTQTFSAFGVDVLFWWNNVTAYLEYRTGTEEEESLVGTPDPDDETQEAIVVQLGYAFPLENGSVIEPAIRFQIIDENTDDDNEVSEFGDGESGGSGTQFDIGINYYLSGHDNKFQLAFTSWSAEEGDADANIITLQHQLNF